VLHVVLASCNAYKRNCKLQANTRGRAFTTLAAFAPLAGSRNAMALLDQGLTVLTGYN